MGNNNSALKLERKLDINHKPTSFGELNLKLISVESQLRILEELRWNFAYKWSRLIMLSGAAILETPTLRSVMKAITWNLTSFSDLCNCCFSFDIDYPFISLDQRLLTILMTHNKKSEASELSSISSILDAFTYFMSFVKEREGILEQIQPEISQTIIEIKSKVKEAQLNNQLSKELKEIKIISLNSNLLLLQNAFSAIKQMSSVFKEIAHKYPKYVKEFSEQSFFNSINNKRLNILLIKNKNPLQIVSEISNKPKLKSISERLQASYIVGKEFYIESQSLIKPHELEIHNVIQPEQPSEKDLDLPKTIKKNKSGLFMSKMAKNLISIILSKEDNEYADEFDKIKWKKQLKEMEEEKKKTEVQLSNLRQKWLIVKEEKISLVNGKLN